MITKQNCSKNAQLTSWVQLNQPKPERRRRRRRRWAEAVSEVAPAAEQCALTEVASYNIYKCKKKLNSLKQTVFNDDTAYITQLKQQKSKRWYYFCSTSP